MAFFTAMKAIHTPVLLEECLLLLCPKAALEKGDIFMVDATLGEGGHTEAFLRRYPSLSVAGVDADSSIIERAMARLSEFEGRVFFFNAWSDAFFSEYPENLPRPDIILMDLGISLFHYERSGRGFSFRSQEPLDMRIDASLLRTAADIVNSSSERDLANILFSFAEERYSRQIASAIVKRRRLSSFSTARDLAECVYSAVPPSYRRGKLHPATRTFQALRIAVNRELSRLPIMLEKAFAALKTGGFFGVIAFHSLEASIVKTAFRNLCKNCTCPPEMPICKCRGKASAIPVTKKAVKPAYEEIKANPPSRSARLRVIQKIA